MSGKQKLSRILFSLVCMCICLSTGTIAQAKVRIEQKYDSANGSTKTIIAENDQGYELWKRTYSGSDTASHVYRIGENGGRYYYLESGTVVALDAKSGNELWRSSEFMSEKNISEAKSSGLNLNADPLSAVSTFDSEGNLYLGGVVSPQLCVLSPDGRVIAKVDTLNPRYQKTEGLWWRPDGTLLIKYAFLDRDYAPVLVSFNLTAYGVTTPAASSGQSGEKERIVASYGDFKGRGRCGADGADISWTAFSNKGQNNVILEITGTEHGNGKMADYRIAERTGEHPPYHDLADEAGILLISDNVETIGKGAFSGFYELKEAYLGKDVRTIDVDAFWHCSKLNRVVLPAGTDLDIYWGAFSGCSNLPELSLPEGAKIEAYDGSPYYAVHEFQDKLWITGLNGETLASSVNGDFKSVCCYGDGYYLLYNDTSGFSAGEQYYRIIKNDGSLVFPQITCDRFAYDGLDYLRYGSVPARFKYCGGGVFAIIPDPHNSYRTYFFNCRTGASFRANIVNLDEVDFSTDDYIAVSKSTWYGFDSYDIISSSEGVIHTFEGDNLVGRYSEGGFIYYHNFDLRFYDLATGESWSICKDSDKAIYKGGFPIDAVFVNGQATIELFGSDNKTYEAVVDKQGNYIVEPHLKS